jgi:hypothetical protein
VGRADQHTAHPSPACIVSNEPEIDINLMQRLRGSGLPGQAVLNSTGILAERRAVTRPRAGTPVSNGCVQLRYRLIWTTIDLVPHQPFATARTKMLRIGYKKIESI